MPIFMYTYQERLQRKIEQWKSNLIDLSKRNRLLNFKSSGSSVLLLDQVECDSLIISLLKGRSIKVSSLVNIERLINSIKKKPIKSDEEDFFEQEAQVEKVALNKLEKQLNDIRLKGNLSISEKGVNTLFLAVGLLKWKEIEFSKEFLTSPLLLVPVSLSRNSSKDPMFIQKHEDDIVINPVLEQKMLNDFGITFPDLDEDNIEKVGARAFLNELDEILTEKEGWEVQSSVYLSLFSFNKLVMYKDLEQYQSLLETHPFVQRLNGENNEHSTFDESGIPAVEEVDRNMSSTKSFQILDADSSQQEAIIAAKKGLSFIMQGPPGTGKSQTIANIISESLAQGKKVLFVSEKMAALEVVKKRLEDCGLGHYCLDLHSNKANKKYVLEQLIKNLSSELSVKSKMDYDSLDLTKKQLNQYTQALHAKVAPLNLTAHQVHGQIAKLDETRELFFPLEKIGQYSQEHLQQLLCLVEKVEEVKPVLLAHNTHPWKDAIIMEFTNELHSNVNSLFESFAHKLSEIKPQLEQLIAGSGVSWDTSLEVMERFFVVADLLTSYENAPLNWINKENENMLERATQLLAPVSEKVTQRNEKYNVIAQRYHSSVFDMDIDHVIQSFTTQHEKEIKLYAKSTADFMHTVFTHDDKLLQICRQAIEACQALLMFREYIQQELGLKMETVTEFSLNDIDLIYEKVKNVPRPAEKWFDSSIRDELLKEYQKSRKVTEELLQEKRELSILYDLDVFSQTDIKEVYRRFTEDYTSAFRFFNRQYRNDMKKLRLFRKDSKKITYHTAVQDLRLAHKMQTKVDYLLENKGSISAWLGPIYQGEETLWELLWENMHHIFHLCDAGKVSIKFMEFLLRARDFHIQTFGEKLEDAKRQYESLTEAVESLKTLFAFEQELDAREIQSKMTKLYDIIDFLYNQREGFLAYHLAPGKPTYQEILNDLLLIQEVHKLSRDVESMADTCKTCFGSLFDFYQTDWQSIEQAITWSQKICTIFDQRVPQMIMNMLEDSNKEKRLEFIRQIHEIKQKFIGTQTERAFFGKVFRSQDLLFEGKDLYQAHLDIVITRLRDWVATSHQLEEWTLFKQYKKQADDMKIGSFVDELVKHGYTEASYKDLFLKRFYRLWLDYSYEQLPILRQFRVHNHEIMISRFKELDVKQLLDNSHRINEILNDRKNTVVFDLVIRNQLSLLKREHQKKTKHLPIRRLFERIPDLISVLKPCIMVSPLSVSQFIDPNIHQFDLVIFDEASQIGSEDAIGAIIRGEQIIIAGDSKQLPPTRFFTAQTTDDEYEEDEDETIGEMYESILDECAVFMPERSLNWHYRSKHESLIAFSNRYIYDNKLFTFPSSINRVNDGVSLVYVPDGVYDRGGSRSNKIEAKRVAELILKHVESTPERSLGVIAFSEAQQNEIREQLSYLLLTHPHLEFFFQEDKTEAFFIKNLENVQGDERDTIILSVGYGKDEAGKLYYSFGPLSKEGGHRRLNVAATRAKYQLILISSLLDTDLDDSRVSKEGPKLLKKFIRYCKTGGEIDLSEGIIGEGDFDSPFEEDVYRSLTEKGFILRPQVGYSGYRIDLGVVHPKRPGEYVLGIECDGAMYHSSRTARDRDRIRQQVLESLGWHIYRIWSQDWFKRKKDIIQELSSVIEKNIERSVNTNLF
ncbi:AAA domain-containing protein [Aneurinibacillus soli]|uniref:ATP-dependent RecD-like DNA helicase n=1 Tax=Aneurinibacillus soli TaxID=1500254 RepID=A0A0U4NG83_9BACL|nr:DUF4011 domain-containing protein [Aneurinibacillus soli]PYE61407.1 AAA domain-containing protein [Aneurinibacillus soli]BAU27764.1 ATP-dependent RecD-like DNA helicase [Aneurinibacillus soli]